MGIILDSSILVAFERRRFHARRSGFSFTELLIVVLIMVVVIGFLIVCIQKLGHEDSRSSGVDARTQTVNNLKQLSLASQSFHDMHKRMPPACDKFGEMKFAAPLQIHLAPFVEQDEFYKAYLKGEGKGEAITAIIPPFLTPQDFMSKSAGVQNFAANLRAFSDEGLNAAFDGDMPPLAAVEPGAAVLFRSFPDGISNTIAFTTKLAECGDGGSRYAAAPDSRYAPFFGQNAAQVRATQFGPTATFQLQPDKDECLPTPLMGQSFQKGGIWVSLFDGSARFVSPEVSARTWNLAVQPNDGMELGEDWNN